MDIKSQSLLSFAALSHETRLDVFRHLAEAEPEGAAAGAIAAAFDMPQNTMSNHLAILSRAGLVRATREGRSIRYRADLEGLRLVLSFLLDDCCGGNPALCNPLIDDLRAALMSPDPKSTSIKPSLP